MFKLKKGFTLIELMVVVAIIAILTGIVTANFQSAKKKSRDTKRVSDIAQIQLALELYFEKCGQYPTGTGGANSTLNALTYNAGCSGGITLGTFLPSIPRPPVGNSETDYKYVGKGLNCTSYHLGSTLETDITADPRGPLYDDADVGRDDTAAGQCISGAQDFSGGLNSANDNVYDVKN